MTTSTTKRPFEPPMIDNDDKPVGEEDSEALQAAFVAISVVVSVVIVLLLVNNYAFKLVKICMLFRCFLH